MQLAEELGLYKEETQPYAEAGVASEVRVSNKLMFSPTRNTASRGHRIVPWGGVRLSPLGM
jgi:hypothetical protein